MSPFFCLSNWQGDLLFRFFLWRIKQATQRWQQKRNDQVNKNKEQLVFFFTLYGVLTACMLTEFANVCWKSNLSAMMMWYGKYGHHMICSLAHSMFSMKVSRFSVLKSRREKKHEVNGLCCDGPVRPPPEDNIFYTCCEMTLEGVYTRQDGKTRRLLPGWGWGCTRQSAAAWGWPPQEDRRASGSATSCLWNTACLCSLQAQHKWKKNLYKLLDNGMTSGLLQISERQKNILLQVGG